MGYVVSAVRVLPGSGEGRASQGETSPTLLLALTFASDCCDGTDEYNSGTVCENTCRWVGPLPGSQAASLSAYFFTSPLPFKIVTY